MKKKILVIAFIIVFLLLTGLITLRGEMFLRQQTIPLNDEGDNKKLDESVNLGIDIILSGDETTEIINEPNSNDSTTTNEIISGEEILVSGE